jgi:hypothetical protein
MRGGRRLTEALQSTAQAALRLRGIGRATGVSMHVIAAMQLSGQAGDMQLPKVDYGAVYNMGGSAVTNYVPILEPLRR